MKTSVEYSTTLKQGKYKQNNLNEPLCVQLLSCVQLFAILWTAVDCSLPGSSVHGIFLARILERLPFLPPGIILTQGPNPCLPHLHFRQVVYC